MDDVKDKVKGFMKKVNNPFSSSSSSGRFKGQGRVLGSSSSSSGPSNSILPRPSYTSQSNSPSVSNSNSKPSPQKTPLSSDPKPELPSSNSNQDRKPANGFDPFESLVTSGKRCRNGFSPDVFECPICGQVYRSEDEVSVHVDSCVNGGENGATAGLPGDGGDSSRGELEACVGGFLSGKPESGSIEVLLKLLKNIVREPENAKFRKIRMGNPKIREAIGDVAGGVELLESVGFELREEDGEMWAAMEVPSEERIGLMKYAVQLLEQQKVQEPQKSTSSMSVASVEVVENVEPRKIDRQVC
ncbi:Zinc finger, C2H2 domain containing protein [Trema orientale]|uniref:Zinc finger, C2H2 domain containing protein n=1 Tax=Trema orientale TaxID=63057 RepID=A0A2P5BG57_TREOI|nr:Zinc finger, C2H2 domain containing protein [Trema orientale]